MSDLNCPTSLRVDASPEFDQLRPVPRTALQAIGASHVLSLFPSPDLSGQRVAERVLGNNYGSKLSFIPNSFGDAQLRLETKAAARVEASADDEFRSFPSIDCTSQDISCSQVNLVGAFEAGVLSLSDDSYSGEPRDGGPITSGKDELGTFGTSSTLYAFPGNFESLHRASSIIPSNLEAFALPHSSPTTSDKLKVEKVALATRSLASSPTPYSFSPRLQSHAKITQDHVRALTSEIPSLGHSCVPYTRADGPVTCFLIDLWIAANEGSAGSPSPVFNPPWEWYNIFQSIACRRSCRYMKNRSIVCASDAPHIRLPPPIPLVACQISSPIPSSRPIAIPVSTFAMLKSEQRYQFGAVFHEVVNHHTLEKWSFVLKAFVRTQESQLTYWIVQHVADILTRLLVDPAVLMSHQLQSSGIHDAVVRLSKLRGCSVQDRAAQVVEKWEC